jgi:hypothetical protein
MWDVDDTQYLSANSSEIQLEWSMPEDDPLLWTKEEQIRAETCAALFAAEYLFDWDPRAALIRLGVPAGDAGHVAKSYMTHWLVQRNIKVRIRNFKRENCINADTALAMVARDASDFSRWANPLARVKAQATLVKVLEMDMSPDKRNGGVGVNGSQGGVMVVGPVLEAEAWEADAAVSQEELISRR